MHIKISALITSLGNLSTSISQCNLPDQTFDTKYGWNYLHISPVDITNTISNIIKRLNQYAASEIPEGLSKTIGELTESINKQTDDVTSYLLDDAGRISAIVPSILFLLQIVNNEIETELFSWDSINSNKLVPKNLKNRLRALDSQLNDLNSDCSEIDVKVKTINSAYEAAESLPAVIQDLNDAREKLTSTIKETRDDINKYKNEISEIKAYIGVAQSESISMRDKIKTLLANTNAYAQSASREGANKRGNSSRLTQSFHFFSLSRSFLP